ncbi:hypothetical protein M0805_001834 [Coniferiporia weirii]|nr:hypothetical protein M0805_001834 [Coniferiporia weirii]
MVAASAKRRTARAALDQHPMRDVVYDDRDPAVERQRMLASDDPLTRLLAPPPSESPAQRAARVAGAAEAKRISDLIDDELNRQRAAERKGPRPVKILLLGKSTTLKNFQLMNSPRAFREERLSWRAVVQLNVVRSVRLVLDAILDAAEAQSPTDASPVSPANTAPVSPHGPLSPTSPGRGEAETMEPLVTQEHLAMRLRLLPLLRAEDVLLERLIPVAAAAGASLREIENSHAPPAPSEGPVDPGSGELVIPTKPVVATGPGAKEVSVFAGSAWKTAFSRVLTAGRGSAEKGGIGEDGVDWNDPRDPTRVLHACGPDLLKLWADGRVRALLRRRKLRLEEMPGFFLDSLDRITSLTYLPTDDDILKARLKTLGVTEYRFSMKAGNVVGHDWRVYDVGGQRSLVPAWVPFFDDMNAIIFLAPISCFDQVLMEDNSVNRLEDSVLLWKSVVSNPLLAKTNLVLFLNKCDVLRAKLAAGIRLGKYVISYADRPNDFEHASDYLRRKFYNIHHDHSPEPRQFYSHFTSVTDTKTTAIILENVADMVLRANLKNTQLIG